MSSTSSKICILMFGLSLFISGCINNTKEKHTHPMKSHDGISYNTDVLGKPSILQIENDTTARRFIISIVDTSTSFLQAINGCGDCFINLEDTTTILTKRKFNKDNQLAFTIQAGINASTYGAEYLFIVWQEQSWKTWEIYKVPFQKFDIRDIDDDGLDEIIEYSSTNDSTIYSFANGLLLRKK